MSTDSQVSNPSLVFLPAFPLEKYDSKTLLFFFKRIDQMPKCTDPSGSIVRALCCLFLVDTYSSVALVMFKPEQLEDDKFIEAFVAILLTTIG